MIKNAMDRGATQEQAAKSLRNSGYAQTEIQQALNQLNESSQLNHRSVLSSLLPNKNLQTHTNKTSLENNQSIQRMQVQGNQINPLPINNSSLNANKPKNNHLKLIVLIAILFLLVGSLIITIFFKDKILSLFG
ncbi:MAG: hypothetical protein Q8P57_02510 [Candidatus Pacearchaeota archaeon]|nr:hypothetical protein [Candidatus Pacearchaeota archaeon]